MPKVKTRKDSTLNMRISTELLEEIKAKAKQAGYTKYQAWVYDLLKKSMG